MASSDENKPCAKCKTGRGIATCDGCRRSFCSNHFTQHRQELSEEMDQIGQNCDLLRRDISEETIKHPFFARVNSWEEDSINKIKKAAEAARADLQKFLDQTKNELNVKIDEMTKELQLSRDSNDFTENEFKRWTEQLNELRQTFECPLNINIENENPKEKVINLIKIRYQQQPTSPLFVSILEESPRSVDKPNITSNEKFDSSNAEAVLSENDLIATCFQKFSSSGAIIYGVNSYSSGTHNVLFRIEKRGLSRLFFGIYSASKKRIASISGSENSVFGWWDINSLVLNGIKEESSSENIISTGDDLILTINCDYRQIQLHHLRYNRQVQIPIDINKCPFPWKLIVKLTSNGDCLRLLQKQFI